MSSKAGANGAANDATVEYTPERPPPPEDVHAEQLERLARKVEKDEQALAESNAALAALMKER